MERGDFVQNCVRSGLDLIMVWPLLQCSANSGVARLYKESGSLRTIICKDCLLETWEWNFLAVTNWIFYSRSIRFMLSSLWFVIYIISTFWGVHNCKKFDTIINNHRSWWSPFSANTELDFMRADQRSLCDKYLINSGSTACKKRHQVASKLWIKNNDYFLFHCWTTVMTKT